MKEVKLTDREKTIELGERVGRLLKAGDVLVLDGDLGAGKTTFTKGLAKGLDIPDQPLPLSVSTMMVDCRYTIWMRTALKTVVQKT